MFPAPRRLLSVGVSLAVLLAACTSTRAPLTYRFDHHAMLVPDLAEASAWLERVFGVAEVVDGTEQEHIRWFTFGGGQTLHVIEGTSEGMDVPKPVHLAVRTPDLDAFVAHLQRIGVEYEDWPGALAQVSERPDGVRQVYVVAPGNYYIEVNDGGGADELLAAP